MREAFQKGLSVLALCIAVVVFAWLVKLVAVRVSSDAIACPQCNVVILDIDVLRADALRCFGTADTITPNLCKLIRQGTNFSNAYSQSYWTLVSSLSIFTSLYPDVNQVWDMQTGALASSSSTLAMALQQDGYQTYYSGPIRDNFLSLRNRGLRGYTYIDAIDPARDRFLSSFQSTKNAQQLILFHAFTEWLHMPYILDSGESPIVNLPKPAGFPVHWDEFDTVFKDYLLSHVSDVFTKDTIIKNPDIFQSDMSVRGQRIFDYFNLLDSQSDYIKRKSAWNPLRDAYMQFINSHSPADVAYLHMMYESMVHSLDTHLASFIDYLLQPDVANHTIVVITSSHGEAFGEHGAFEHVSIPYNEVYHVPLIIKYPHGTGKQVDAIVENIDIFPTLIQLVHGKKGAGLEGASLVPLLSGVSNQAKSYSISINDGVVYVIQNKGYALVVYKDANLKPELYDLIRDPGEQHDIASRYPDIVKRYTYLFQQSRVAPELFLPTTEQLVPSTINKKDLIRSGYF